MVILMYDLYQSSYEIIDEIINEMPSYSKDDGDYEFKIFSYIYARLSSMLVYDDYASEVASLSLGGFDRERAYDSIVYPASDLRVLCRGKALCGGFAKALSVTLEKVGIKSVEVKAEGKHVWNQVYLDGKWYNCDLTNDYDFVNAGLNCRYFLKSNADCPNFKKYDVISEYKECDESISDEKQEELLTEAVSYVNELKRKKEAEELAVMEVEEKHIPKFIQVIMSIFKKEKKNGGSIK